ncbi:uncharacterized protein GVI51_G04213 [Nakaseomyces glabratus]|uniref:GATA-type domain-containing protein n=1 Tax=Candida glabrata (strain ATCC 2001 / BCRC 20586 / JCM 3761 / NBRC 0622 / NRRL Y-65 / CBS 138) TaxID=284593 RepID=Q6FT94_CANGA|nr:uncharacterized protein CAGL0G04389g [Nakaseomyces glabratus]KAH7603303.1 GATA-type zinc finger domain profile [Nakaseomyces glabratus]KAH7606826.1 GATA-type zinc finger domain profile [Nakaseomyces glabratus]QHS66183.1 uncharacterized protein GVI51_G04213 [Nakaseomyces glabratus]CAG59477.1 unnamed protein product [Nakaseomyces glabratus]|eukprot:XP_446550.1 uncharacterized protein CAGL0G04389g [[Candida] glabrata]
MAEHSEDMSGKSPRREAQDYKKGDVVDSEHKQSISTESSTASKDTSVVQSKVEQKVDSKKEKVVAQGDTAGIVSEFGNSAPVCKNCMTSTTPLWRRDEQGSVLCNACGLFLKLHGKPRPISLKTDVIKSRNRKNVQTSPTGAPAELVHDRYKHSFTNFIPTSYEAYKEKKGHMLDKRRHPPSDLRHSITEHGRPYVGESAEADLIRKHKKAKIKSERAVSESSIDSYNSQSKDSAQIKSGENTPLSPQSHSPSGTPLPRLSAVLGDFGSDSRTTAASNSNIGSMHAKSSEDDKNGNIASLEQSMVEKRKTSIPQVVNSNQSYGGLPTALRGAPIRDSRSTGSNIKEKMSQPQPLDTSHLSHIPPNPHLLMKGKVPSSENLPIRRGSMIDTQKQRNSVDIIDPSNADDEHKIPVSVQLHNEEEVIRLRTRINELELVTDLYKRHIYELDERCKKLEKELRRYK